MSARVLLTALAPLLAVACTHRGARRLPEGLPKHERTSPTALTASSSSSTPIGEKDVVLIFPAIDERHALHWNARESFRLVLPRTPAAVERGIPPGKALGDLRTTDRTVAPDVYRTLRCGFGRTWNGTRQKPQQFLDAGFCTDGDPTGSRRASIGLVDEVLDDLRAKAVSAGVQVVNDVRCYAAPDPHRLWCEGSAEVLTQ